MWKMLQHFFLHKNFNHDHKIVVILNTNVLFVVDEMQNKHIHES